ncbi:MAG: DHH family phosphoesterase [Methanolinea sp.]|nr:DHH family phosphoesterase [Methanolinea sp.]
MSLEDAAQRLAEHLAMQEFVEVYAHHDADGIAAGSIICCALLRRDIRFRLRVLSRVSPAGISPETPTLLCDFGAGMEDLPGEVMVIDHHLPHFQGALHVNPRLHQIDGDRELSSSGAAYLVAQFLGDNRDLAGLAMLGILGDGQEMKGMNHTVFNEAVTDRIVTPARGCLLPGRNGHERLLSAINPYLHMISGDEMAVADLLDAAAVGESVSREILLSLLVIRISPFAPAETLLDLYGDRYELEREVIPDAHTFAAVVDACGKSGRGGLAASLCLRSTEALPDAWEAALRHRMQVVHAIREAFGKTGSAGFYEVEDPTVASDVADALARDSLQEGPVMVAARSDDLCHISVRTPRGMEMNLGIAVREAAIQCGGIGGGHHLRAGATINCSRLEQFREHLQKAVAG